MIFTGRLKSGLWCIKKDLQARKVTLKTSIYTIIPVNWSVDVLNFRHSSTINPLGSDCNLDLDGGCPDFDEVAENSVFVSVGSPNQARRDLCEMEERLQV